MEICGIVYWGVKYGAGVKVSGSVHWGVGGDTGRGIGGGVGINVVGVSLKYVGADIDIDVGYGFVSSDSKEFELYLDTKLKIMVEAVSIKV